MGETSEYRHRVAGDGIHGPQRTPGRQFRLGDSGHSRPACTGGARADPAGNGTRAGHLQGAGGWRFENSHGRISEDRRRPVGAARRPREGIATSRWLLQRLGQMQSQQIYERIVRDFAEQPVAAQARSRLAEIDKAAHTPAPSTLTQRKIEAAGRIFDTGDTDGRQVVYTQRSTGDELIHGDLAGTHQSTIFKAKKGAISFSRPSRDFSMVVVGLREQPGPAQVWAVMKIDGAGYREVLRYGPQDDRFRDTDFRIGPGTIGSGSSAATIGSWWSR